MLRSIAIRDFILIDEVLLDFSDGMTAITGETGAGKSLILTAIEFTLGAKIETKLIRQGCAYASVTVEFTNISSSIRNVLQDAGIDVEDCLVIRRTLSSDNRSRVFINDQVVGVKLAQSIFSALLEIHGQRDSILDPETQLASLDQFAGILPACKDLAGIYSRLTQVKGKLAGINSKLEQATKEQDYVKSCIDELECANILKNEESELLQQRSVMKNSAKLQDFLMEAESLCSIENLLKAQRLVAKAIELHPNLNVVSAAIEVATAAVDDVLAKLDEIRHEISSKGSSLDNIEERLILLRGLARKHSCGIDLLSAVLKDLKCRVSETEDLVKQHASAKAELDQVSLQYDALANEITAKRKAAASELSSIVNANLSSLRLAQCKFQISIENLQKISITGQDAVTFLVSTNPGMPLAKIDKIASGGEAARVMLAIKVALARAIDIPTFIFDEIDSGTGGVAAASIGSMLDAMSVYRQVFVITHSPQVAVYAKKHILVKKLTINGQNITNIGYVEDQEKTDTVAKMLTLDDNVTTEARQAAQKLFSVCGNRCAKNDMDNRVN